MLHVMLDLETMGTDKDAAIVSIGAVYFDEQNVHKKRGSFYRVIDLQSCLDNGNSIKASTIYWWLQQSEEARKAVCSKNKVPIQQALREFFSFYKSFLWKIDDGERRIWSAGAAFDISIFEESCRKEPLASVPWRYTDARCFRTFKASFGDEKIKPKVPENLRHNALTDAIWQAEYMVAMCQRHSIILR